MLSSTENNEEEIKEEEQAKILVNNNDNQELNQEEKEQLTTTKTTNEEFLIREEGENKISFQSIGGATHLITINNSLRIACDPVLCPKNTIQNYGFFKSKRLQEPIYNKEELQKVNLWLLTHGHEDHLDKFGMDMINYQSNKNQQNNYQQNNEQPIIIAHKSCKIKNQKVIFLETDTCHFIENCNGFQIKIRAIPAIHSTNVMLGKLIGNANGYLVQVNNNLKKPICTFYITGDSVFNKEITVPYFQTQSLFPTIVNNHNNNKTNQEFNKIDFIIANAGGAHVNNSNSNTLLSKFIGRITNNKNDIIELTRELNPIRNTFVIHHGTFEHYLEKLERNDFEKIDERIQVVFPGEVIEWLA
ncbi:hypothetical protein ABK040_016071 [Willaertia magna]